MIIRGLKEINFQGVYIIYGMEDQEFEKYIEEAVSSLPSEFRDKLENVSFFVQDYPTSEQYKKLKLRENSTYLLGLYEGTPHTKRGRYGIGPTLPDRIILFKYPHLGLSRTREDLIKRISNTVLHEIGHHFGMNEEEIRRAEAERRKRQSP